MRRVLVTGWAIATPLCFWVLSSGEPFEQAPSESASPALVAGIEAHLAAREYRASENGEGLQAPNRAHNLRTYFDATGIRIHDRTAAGSPELLRLSLSGVGRDGEVAATGPGAEVVAQENRVEIRRPGLVEWFVNGPDGLEQGFTLAERPSGEGRLRLELSLAGAEAVQHDEELVFETTTGRKLAYGKLAVVDARGVPLAAEFALADAGRIAFSVDDAAAAYPIAIDPLLSATADGRIEADQASAFLGASVASAGDVNGDGYGDVIVGATHFDNGQADEGAAFIFLGSANGVPNAGSLSAQTQLEGDQSGASLGESVASAGDVNGDGYGDVIVGALNFTDGQFDEGAAFVFLGSATGVADGNPATAHARLESDQVDAGLGISVASAGDVNGDGYGDVVVGAWGYDNGETDEGAAFVFLGSATGVADGNPTTAHAWLEANQSQAFMGGSVAAAGDVNGDAYGDVIVGAHGYSHGQNAEGAAFVFLGGVTGLAGADPSTAHASLEGDQVGAWLGRSVASAGDVNGDGYADVIVGAPYYVDGQTDEGAAFVFLGGPSGLSNGNPATAHARFESDQVLATLGQGNSVASAGDVNGDGYADVIVGFGSYDNGQTDEGGAFVFHGSASGLTNGNPSTADTRLQSDQGGANLGFSVASAGDVNGDGFADVIVGAPGYDAVPNVLTDGGAAFVFLGSASGIPDGTPATAQRRLELDQPSSDAGWSVASAGDVNGDGYADVIVGVPAADSVRTNTGMAFVSFGSPSGIGGAFGAVLVGDQQDALLGESVASAGDVNGDGYADVIVGGRLYDSSQTDEGAAFVFQGGGNRDGRAVLARQRRGDGSGIAVQPWGESNSGGGFAAELRANHPQGTGRVKAQIEACPSGVPFGDASCANTLSSSWIPVNGTTPDVSISRVVPGLVGNGLYRWRARVLHAAATGTIPAHPAHGPWRRLGAQATEADIRVPEPGWLSSLASGALLLAALSRTTRRRRASPSGMT